MPISGPGLDQSLAVSSDESDECLQCSKKRLGFFRSRYRRRWSRAWGKSTQTDITQRRAQRPAFWHVVLHSYICVPQLCTRGSKTSYHVLYDGVVDKVVKPQPIRILKLEFVVVGEEAKEVEGGEDLGTVVAILNVLQIVSNYTVRFCVLPYLHK
jgi:hypothetical protein